MPTYRIADYRQILQLRPNDAWTWHNLSIAYYRTQQLADAKAANRQALRLLPFEAAQHMARAIQSAEAQAPHRRNWQFWKT